MKLKRLKEIREELDKTPKRVSQIQDEFTAGYFAAYLNALCELLDGYIDLVTDLDGTE